MPSRLAAALLFAGLAAPATAADLLAPARGQTDLEAAFRAGFAAGGSVVSVRENEVAGDRVRFADLGLGAEGSWLNDWDSLRREGGEVRLSQSSLDLRARLVWDDARWRGWRPSFGVFFAHFSQNETSGEDGNFVRYVSYGPEAAVLYSF